ncbi:unnamed protein product [Gulo gulo]|uniref:Tumor suppressor candidate 5 n=1 Tax=Gulo gulo TaxID=48420 RepID=A0A9X9Q0B4_GULGU|nr:unnamed protein product [Gulo gulo]
MANPGQPQFPSAQEPGTASPLDLPEMEKLLTKVEGKDDKPLKLSTSLSGALDLEQNGHGLPFKVVSEGRPEATLPWSASRASSRRASSIATASSAQDQEVPKDYLILAIASCFCPVWPLNLIPLIFSIMVSVAPRSRAQWAPDPLPGACRTESWGRGLGGRLPFSPGLLPLLLERGPGPGDLLFAVLPLFCSSALQRLCTYPPGEGTPRSHLDLNSTLQTGGQVGVFCWGCHPKWGCGSVEVGTSVGSQDPEFSGGEPAASTPYPRPPGYSSGLCQRWFPRAGRDFPATRTGPWGQAPPRLLLQGPGVRGCFCWGPLGLGAHTDSSICLESVFRVGEVWAIGEKCMSEGMAGPA